VVTDAVRSKKVHLAANLRIFECTMAPEIGTGRWLQREASAKNPFYGSAMLKCGVELDRKAAARALPPGHPPIEGLTPADYARYAGAKPTPAASDGCGSCGMSKEAMAAGEPCEHGKK
jgi:Cu(I)/Ag(I) efflux system membrane fusion protein